MRLWLIRHFEPAVAPGICYGQTDLALRSSLDEQTARLEALCAQLAAQAPANSRVFSSSLRRCAEIADRLSGQALRDDRLREIDFGDWEMQTWEAIGAEALDAWAKDPAGFRPPRGETGYELQRRALHWLRATAEVHDAAIVVTHAGVMRALQAHHHGLPGAQWLTLRYDYGQLLTLDFSPEQIAAAPVQ